MNCRIAGCSIAFRISFTAVISVGRSRGSLRWFASHRRIVGSAGFQLDSAPTVWRALIHHDGEALRRWQMIAKALLALELRIRRPCPENDRAGNHDLDVRRLNRSARPEGSSDPERSLRERTSPQDCVLKSQSDGVRRFQISVGRHVSPTKILQRVGNMVLIVGSDVR